MKKLMDRAMQMLQRRAGSAMSELEFLEAEIKAWMGSERRRMQMDGERYYLGEHDILARVRQAIGQDGTLEEIDYLPNNRIVDNQYALRVDQKVNYLLGKPLTMQTENKGYDQALKGVFGKAFMRLLKEIGTQCLNGGVCYLHPHYDEVGAFKMKVFPSYEILPFWRDREHTELEAFLRVYDVEGYEGRMPIKITKVEYYTAEGVRHFTLNNGQLTEEHDNGGVQPYLQIQTKGGVKPYNWERMPLVAFRCNAKEIPLIGKVKSLQDGINSILSNFQNNMEEDYRNTILVLVNYDGQDLGEFRHNLAKYGAVKVTDDGDVRSLSVEVNCENYKTILEVFKKALIENARSFDAKDDRMGGNPNQMNIQSMYSEIDLDANGMEMEFQAALEELLWFVQVHLCNSGQGDYEGETVDVVFNRDVLVNTSVLIQDINNSMGLLSEETLLMKHPFVGDLEEELKRKQRSTSESEVEKEDKQKDDEKEQVEDVGEKEVVK